MEEVLAVRDAYRAQEWAKLIRECSASGLTKWEFCQHRGISEKSFYKLKNIAPASPAPAGEVLVSRVSTWLLLYYYALQ